MGKIISIVDMEQQTIGHMLLHTRPYGNLTEERQGTIESSGALETVEETIRVLHTIEWLDARRYPDEIASVENPVLTSVEIGKRVNGVWIAAGTIEEAEPMEDHTCVYQIFWFKAFQHLPTCRLSIFARRSNS